MPTCPTCGLDLDALLREAAVLQGRGVGLQAQLAALDVTETKLEAAIAVAHDYRRRLGACSADYQHLQQALTALLARIRPGSEAAPWVIEALAALVGTPERS